MTYHRLAPGGFAVFPAGGGRLGVVCDHEGGAVYHCVLCGPPECDRCRTARRVRRALGEPVTDRRAA